MDKHEIETILITGANAGIGKEVARQLAMKPDIQTIYLACRDERKAIVAKRELEEATKRSIFKIVLLDLTDLTSVRSLVNSFQDRIDAVVLNAGGTGGKDPMALTENGTSYIFAQNVLGHAALLEGMLASGKLTKTAVFLGSEGARGVPKMGIKRPSLATSSVDEFADIASGKAYAGQKLDIFSIYGAVKYVGVLWLSSLARRYPNVRLVSISPGGTQGTEAANSLSPAKRFFYNRIYMPALAPIFGLAHSLGQGARRIVDGLFDETLLSGHFYASKANTLTGPIVDQQEVFADIGNPSIQDRAAEAVHLFLGK